MNRSTAFILLSFLLFPSLLLAQQNPTITGKLVDDKTGKPIGFAQVVLQDRASEELVTGAVAEGDGSFALQAPSGQYTLVVSFVGYKKKTMPIRVSDSPLAIGAIKLQPDTEMMDAVVVEAAPLRQPIKAGLEGIEIAPDLTISNTGGSLLDVLRNTPSVRVNDDGTVSIRGSSSTNILIDGRNTALASDLEQIPASAIKNIKIINNPNARYDAEAAGGIINIELKEGEFTGSAGRIEATAGTRFRSNLNLSASHTARKFEVYGGYSFRYWPRVGSSSSRREIFSQNELLEQYSEDESSDLEHTINLGSSFRFGRNTLSYEGVFNKEDESDTEINRTRLSQLEGGEPITRYIRLNDETEENYTLDNALIYNRLFDDENRSFRALISHSLRDQLELQNIGVYNGVFRMEQIDETPNGVQRALSDEYRSNTILQADWEQPSLSGQLELGYKSTFRSFDTDYDYEILDQDRQLWVNQEGVSNRFLYQDQIHAAYLIYTRKLGKFEVSAGTRAEYTRIDTKLFETNEENGQEYLNLFPSLQTSYAASDAHILRFTYSRRIDRPNAWRLNPFPDVSDSLNVRVGNPNLQPEYINSFEVGHLYSKGLFTLTSTLFYRHINNQIDYIVRVRDGISYRGPLNLNTQQTYGLEMISTFQLFSWWQMNASYSFFGVQVDGSNLDESFTNSGSSWYAKFNSDFLLPWQVNLQLTGNYTSPEIEAQGRDLARYYLDASMQKKFMDDKLRLSLSLRDVFNTRRFAGENYGEDFVQTFERQRETRIFLLSVMYRLGNYQDRERREDD